MSSLIEISKGWVGRTIDGRFVLEKWLGGSAHSAVFLTSRGGNGSQKAAVKLVPAEAGAAQNVKQSAQLFRWADIAKLSHPNLVRLFDSGRCQIDGASFSYVVMEYAEEDLAQILPQRPLSPAEVEEMLPPLVDALIFLHHAGYVHGGLKPSNIMAVANQLKVSTDGLGKAGEPIGHDRSAYDAPEAAAAGMAPASDVWSLGSVLAAVLTQREPEVGDRQGGSATVSEAVPEPFHEIARRCLTTDPRRRSSLGDVLNMLEGAAPAPTEAVQKPAAIPRKKRWMILAIAAALILLAVWAGHRMVKRQGPGAADTTRPEETRTSPADSPAGQSSPPFAEKLQPAQTGSASGSVLRQVLPEVSRSAQGTIHGRLKVGVEVSVDTSGNVSQAKLISPGPSRYFASQALAAARRWKFNPPQRDGQASLSEWILRFQFGRTSTQVSPAQVKP
jgi:TonB family protein